MNQRAIFTGTLVFFTLTVTSIHAQQTSQISDVYLTSLYATKLRNPESSSIQARIDAERARIRALAEAELKASIPSFDATGKPPQTETSSEQAIAGSVESQRSIVNGLETKIQSWNADLSLLRQEEKMYLTPAAETGSNAPSRLTKTHQELLAKEAVLEERIAAATPILNLENDRLSKLTQNERLEQFSVFFTIGFYILVLIVIIVVERLLRTILFARISDRNRRYITTKVFAATVYIITIIWLVNRVLSEYPGVLTTLAIIGAGVAFALQETVKDIVGWTLILQKRLFKLGDRIQVGDYIGEVIDISILRTTLLEVGTSGSSSTSRIQDRTGKTFFLPNSLVLSQRILNYNTTSDYMKAEIIVTITYESDWKKAEETAQIILEEETGAFAEKERQQHNRRTRLLYVPYEPGAPRVFLDLAASGIHLVLRFTIPIDEQREVVSRITKKILERFTAAHIDFAYHTTRSISTLVEQDFFNMKSTFSH